MLAATVGYAQDDTSLRTWRDSSGTFSVKAKLLKRDGEMVHLEKADGTRATVPLGKLSKADQDFLSKQLANPFETVTDSTDDAEAVSVVVWVESDGRTIPKPGYILSRNHDVSEQSKDRAIVIFDRSGAKKARVAICQSGELKSELDATVLSNQTGNRSVDAVTIPSAGLPTSFREMKAGTPNVGDIVHILGFDVDVDGESVSRIKVESKVEKVFRNLSGRVARVDVSNVSEAVPAKSIAVDANGHLLGVVAKKRNKNAISVVPQQIVVGSFAPTITQAVGRILGEDKSTYTVLLSGSVTQTLDNSPVKLVVHPSGNEFMVVGERYSEAGVDANAEFEESNRSSGQAFHCNLTLPKASLKNNAIVLQAVSTSSAGIVSFGRPRVVRCTKNSKPPFGRQEEPSAQAAHSTPTITSVSQWAKTKAPKPKPINNAVATPLRNLSGLKSRTITGVSKPKGIAWASDGESWYSCSANGIVSRVEYPSFVETHRLETKAVLDSICVTKSSVVVAMPRTNELLVLSPKDLTVVAKISGAPFSSISGSPKSDRVYAEVSGQIAVVDIKKFQVVSKTVRRGYRFPEVTPDGEFVFASKGGSICRFRLSDDQLKFEQSSIQLASSGGKVCVCADSQHVALPFAGGNRVDRNSVVGDGFPPLSYGTYLFHVNDLAKPALSINSGAYPRTIEVDPVSGEIYAQNHDHLLMIFSNRGAKVAEYRAISGADPVEYWVHPKGGSMLVQANEGLVWVEVPKERDRENSVSPRPGNLKGNNMVDDSVNETLQKLEAGAKKWAELNATEPNKQIAGPEYELTGLKTQAIQIKDVSSVPVWTADGKAFYLCNSKGRVSRVSYPEFVETHRLELNTVVKTFCLTKSSVVVSVHDDSNILELSKNDLSVKRSFHFGGIEHVSASPESDLLYVDAFDTIQVFDLSGEGVVTERIFSKYRDRYPVVTPDGKFVFAHDSGRITRFRVVGKRLEREETSQVIAHGSKRVCVCADSKHVALPGRGGNRIYGSNERMDRPGTFLFSVDDLSRPKVLVETEPDSMQIDIDPMSGQIYAANSDRMIRVFGRNGKPYAAFRGLRDSGVRYAIHPAGRSLLALCNRGVIFVRIPEAPIESTDGEIDDREWLASKAPKPVTVTADLRGKKLSETNGAKIQSIALKSGMLAAKPVFSNDGRQLYTLSPRGLVRIISTPEFKTKTQIDLGVACTDLSLSSEGLVVCAPGHFCLYVLDVETLAIKRRILSSATQHSSRPNSQIAFATSSVGREDRLMTIDLRAGRVTSEKTAPELVADAMTLRPGSEFRPDKSIEYLEMTPDCKTLLLYGGRVSRFAIDEGNLTFMECTPFALAYARDLIISPDGKLGTLLTTTRSRSKTTPIFSTAKLNQPPTQLRTNENPRGFAFNSNNDEMFVLDGHSQIVVRTASGASRLKIVFGDESRYSALIAHPQGKKVLAIGQSESSWIELTPPTADK